MSVLDGLDVMANAYPPHCCNRRMRHHIHRSAISGSLTTALPEDVFHLIDMQLSLLEEYLQAKHIVNTETGISVLTECVHSIVRNLWYHQSNYRYTFLRDVESSIAAANDHLRMMNKVEKMMRQIAKGFPQLDWEEQGQGGSTTSAIRRDVSSLIFMFSSDAVNASQRVVGYIMRDIQTSNIALDLFTSKWEDVMVHNEVAISVVKTLEDYLNDVRNYIEHEFLYCKIVAALVRATVSFYVQCFVKKAQQMRHIMKRDFARKRAQKFAFRSTRRAITRMTYDVQIFRDYFHSLAHDFPPLMRLVSDELSILVVLIECMCLAAGHMEDGCLNQYAVVVHKKITGTNSAVTRHFLSDVWLLLGPKDAHLKIEREVKMMDKDLQRISARVKEEAPCHATTTDQSMYPRLDKVLRSLYEDRIIQENSFLCGSITRRQNGQSNDRDFSKATKGWKPLQGVRQRLDVSKDERQLSLIFKNLK